MVGAYDGVLEAAVEVIVCGVVLPALLGVGWCVCLWFFAGFIVYAMLLALIAAGDALGLACFKGGWFDSSTDEVDTSDGSGCSTRRRIVRSSSSSSSSAALTNVTLSGLLSEASSDEQTYYQIAAVVTIVLTAIFVLLIFFWRKCIGAIAIAETTKVFRTLRADGVAAARAALPAGLRRARPADGHVDDGRRGVERGRGRVRLLALLDAAGRRCSTASASACGSPTGPRPSRGPRWRRPSRTGSAPTTRRAPPPPGAAARRAPAAAGCATRRGPS